jgi:uncharacterized protein
MTNEERDIITQFIARVGGAQASQSAFTGSVPATTPALPPVDREADGLIGDLFNRYPDARYRMTQLAFVQEHALSEAQNRIQQLEANLQQAAQQAQQRQGSGGGFFSGLFGGRPQGPPPQGGPSPVWNQGQPNYQYQQAPQPQYAPGYQPGMFQRQGSGFLGSALSTAAGVTGGMLAANALMNLFSGPHSGGYPGYGGPAAGPWGAPPDQGYADQGTWSQGAGAGQADPGYVDNGTWDTSGGGDPGAAPDSSDSWDSGSSDSSWDSGSGSTDDTSI